MNSFFYTGSEKQQFRMICRARSFGKKVCSIQPKRHMFTPLKPSRPHSPRGPLGLSARHAGAAGPRTRAFGAQTARVQAATPFRLAALEGPRASAGGRGLGDGLKRVGGYSASFGQGEVLGGKAGSGERTELDVGKPGGQRHGTKGFAAFEQALFEKFELRR